MAQGTFALSIELIGVIILIIGALSFRLDPVFGYSALVISMLLGSAAAVTLSGFGNIQPAHVLLGVVLLFTLHHSEIRPREAIFGISSPAFWLICTWIYGVCGAYFLPRFFEGRFSVNAVNSARFVGGYTGLFQVPLEPTNGNITQSIYFTGDVICFLLFLSFASDERRFRLLTKIFVAYCAADVFFGVLDVATAQAGLSDALQFMRNSTYIIYSDSTFGSATRIIGSFTEASAFAAATIGAFCFSIRLWLGGVYPRISLPLAGALFILLMFSTSSTAYAALLPCVGFIYGGAVLRLLRGKTTKQDVPFMAMVPLLIAVSILIIALNEQLARTIGDLLNALLFDKSLSQSGLERARFNAEGYQTFLDSLGFGTGIGSVRTSSFPIAALSSLGVIGSFFYAMFIGFCLFGSRTREDSDYVIAVRSAARSGCLGLLVAASISGSMIDLGLPFFALAALAVARPMAPDPEALHPFERAKRIIYPLLATPNFKGGLSTRRGG